MSFGLNSTRVPTAFLALDQLRSPDARYMANHRRSPAASATPLAAELRMALPYAPAPRASRAIRYTADGTEGTPTLSTTVDKQTVTTTVTVSGAEPTPPEHGLYLPIIEGTREYYGTR